MSIHLLLVVGLDGLGSHANVYFESPWQLCLQVARDQSFSFPVILIEVQFDRDFLILRHFNRFDHL